MNPMKSKDRTPTIMDRIWVTEEVKYWHTLSHSHATNFSFQSPSIFLSRAMKIICASELLSHYPQVSSSIAPTLFYKTSFLFEKKSSHFCWLVSEDPEPTLLQTRTIMAHFHVDSEDSNSHPPSYIASALNLSHLPSHPSAVLKNT